MSYGTYITTPTPLKSTLFVPGVPKAQPRPRATRRGKHAGVYNPGTADEWKAEVSSTAKATGWLPKTPARGSLQVRMVFLLPRPKRLKKGQRELHLAKPDIDNLVKAVMDTLTRAGLWKDDSQVVALSARKYYAASDEPTGLFLTVKDVVGGVA